MQCQPSKYPQSEMKPYELTDGDDFVGFLTLKEQHVAHVAQKKLVSDMNSKCPHFPELHLRKWNCGECRFEYLKEFEIGE